ncbi:hypothetical protein GO988_23215 [Hymenobacter sp. HMF4947]|uniref:DUF4760 domain-containing protein n=1 Tax=Hymenobacter ginkgonis TaxID=2682976 RepID=A0A7K1TLK9_9BACT|nr:hypothetical protein [Hymenobacter ginkgonis]MVN79253.1 hypothetical protein [Hymenobacter ginkgonis]
MNFILPLCCVATAIGGWRIIHRQKMSWVLLFIGLVVAAFFGCIPSRAQALSQIPLVAASKPIAPVVAPNNIQPAASQQLSASVTDKHPYAVYFVLIAASLAAMASLASSSLAAWVAWKSKDKEYRNDYYKKVIDKRMKAIEAAEEMLSILSMYKAADDGSGTYYEYFEMDLGPEILTSATKKFASLTTWSSRELVLQLRQLVDIVSAVCIEADGVEKSKQQAVYVRRYPIVNSKLLEIQYLIGLEMEQLYDVKGFFKNRYSQFKPRT